MPDEKATEPHISNYAPDELVTKAMNAGRGFSGAVHVYTRDEASSKFDYFVRLFEHILSGLKWLLPIEPGSVYFAFVGGGVPFRAARVERDAFVILADPRAINYAMILTSRLQVLGPMARRFKTESVEPTKDYSGMYLLDIAKDLIFHEELVRESTEVNGVTPPTYSSLYFAMSYATSMLTSPTDILISGCRTTSANSLPPNKTGSLRLGHSRWMLTHPR
ncbi:hypothetical protein ELH53_15460 [Rhizobium ruizarguesonis]|nr:hypothetical protein ELH53_15460 [Rhizobium ruizarguesonis]